MLGSVMCVMMFGDAAAPRLGAADWAVLAAYGLVLACAGVAFGLRDSKDSGEYFLAARRMPVWPVVFSILATAQSAATFIGVPERAYVSDLTYLSLSLGPIVAALVVAYVFIPAYYRAGVGTPYELLQARFGPGARTATSAAFLLGRVFASGARTYIGALPVALVLFGDAQPGSVMWAVVIVMAIGTIYTLWGGVRSVIYTDVVQVCVYMSAALAALTVLALHVSVPWSDVWAAWSEAGKLRVVDTSVELSRSMTLWTALTGFMLLNLAVYATDQDIVQKFLTCRSAGQSARSLIVSTLAGVPVVMVFLAIGLLLWVFYQRPDLVGRAAGAPVPESKDIFQTFMLTQMPTGLAGLMIAGVMAIGPAGINATLNGMSSTLIGDLYRPWRERRGGATERHYVIAGRLGVVVCGVVLGAFAVLCVFWQRVSSLPLVDFAMSVMAFAYAGLLGVFLCALFTRRGSSGSAIAGMLAGSAAVVLMERSIWNWWAVYIPTGGGGTLADVSIAFPWHFVVGTAVSVAVTSAAGRGGGGR